MKVEVVYALAQEQRVVILELAPGATAAEALQASGLARGSPYLGIHGKRVKPERKLRDGDRVEILRPLAEDPKAARRRRARRR